MYYVNTYILLQITIVIPFTLLNVFKKEIVTYVEKPLSVSYTQFTDLMGVYKKSNTALYVGYNRPFSRAINLIKEKVSHVDINIKNSSSFSIEYFISGHKIPTNHWYRNPDEGTRICGNMGHWLDLSIHILAWRKIPDKFYININYSNLDEPDDNLSVIITTDLHDLIVITLTSRTEPFEGINEVINLQFADIIAKIDDFRKITIWQNEKLYKKKFFPKDVGHERAIMQPFHKDKRNFIEIEISTLLMLSIKDMVIGRNKYLEFNLIEVWKKYQDDLG